MTMPVEKVEKWGVQIAVELFFEEGFKDGEIVSHDWLKTVLDIPTPESIADVTRVSFLTLSRVEELKATLLEKHNIFLASARGLGYVVVPPRAQAAMASGKAITAIHKEMAAALSILRHTRTEELDASEAKRHTDVQVKMQALAGMMSQKSRDVFEAFC